jgi:hypothetical protein
MTLSNLPIAVQTFGRLALSKVFMTFDRDGHLPNQAEKPRFGAASVPSGRPHGAGGF